ncbi:MAG: hypothetical protein J6Y89_10545 [Lachnospiraceae bacterium]|nr:hypothetical protein [Lachnospiraceae bacterium]
MKTWNTPEIEELALNQSTCPDVEKTPPSLNSCTPTPGCNNSGNHNSGNNYGYGSKKPFWWWRF